MLRRAISGASTEIHKFRTECDEVERAECECCGLIEDCTPDYIGHIKDSYSGKWVCGLCSEAVKERSNRHRGIAMEEALNSHRDFCQKFNNTTRINPKLSLAWAMRDIAKRSSQHRNSNKLLLPKIGRSSSCGPRIDLI